MTKITLTLAVILLAGCSSVTHLSQRTAGEVREAVSIQADKENSGTQFSGPKLQATTDGSDLNLYYYNLRAFDPTDNEPTKYHLQVFITYRRAWRHYESAELSGGQPVETAPINKSVLQCVSGNECMLEEALDIALTEEQILASVRNRDKLKLKLRAKSGHSSTIEVPANYLLGFYAAVVNYEG
ncbi:hypothetical protein ACJJIE_03610 [Microbulbifer sp. TRSA001]|uniref:hypothetical protein n=1 Tax=unclassified Microbulbifer TaxID=2619833 RepID=UPI0024ACDBC7|nr:hypothetical protein [Microbulbifer sp. VAAF005]WHI46768.1 hypothetical protein P0078_24240 [Microbulbifer sp. VAAF005]